MKFSIITPVYNGEKYIAETIESVLSQKGNFEIEYIVCDGGSTDGTIEILKKYDQLLKESKYKIQCDNIEFKWLSEKDESMYAAINKGFALATGNIFAWINADDIYLSGAFNVVAKTFKKYPEIKWLKGITRVIDEASNFIKDIPCYLYNQEWIGMGIYGRNAYFIHQDSVFWKNELWKKIENIDKTLKLAGDYYLWIQFAKYAKLWSINIPLSCFRKRKHQLSEGMNAYRKEQNSIIRTPKNWLVFRIKLFFWLKSKFNSEKIHPLFLTFYKIIFGSKNSYYVNIDNDSNAIIKKAYSYIA